MPDTIGIKAKAPFPARALSNLDRHAFVLSGVACGSMEGFLQGLKVEDRAEQERICKLSGGEARGRGQQRAARALARSAGQCMSAHRSMRTTCAHRVCYGTISSST
jgi:hypothetical protein